MATIFPNLELFQQCSRYFLH